MKSINEALDTLNEIKESLFTRCKNSSLKDNPIELNALLGTQGRAMQRKFDVEELCEFIAWKLPEINNIMSSLKGWLAL